MTGLSTGQGSRRAILYLAGILLILVCYANSLSNSFHFDDRHVIEDNVYIRSLSNTPRFFRDAHTFSSLPSNATYRPLVSLSLAIDFALGKGLKPQQFHISQIALLVSLFLLVALLFEELIDGRSRDTQTLAVIGAAWFAIHTANTQTMNLISARSELLAAIGVVGSLLIFARSRFGRKNHLHLAPMVAGMLAKATAAIYAPLLLVYLLVFGPPDAPPPDHRQSRLRTAMLVSLPAFAAAAAGLFFIFLMTPREWTAGAAQKLHYIQTQPWIAMHYLRLFFLPVGLSADTDLPLITKAYDTRILFSVMAISALLWAAARLSRERSTRPIAFGIFWFFLTLLPTSLFPLAEVANEHRILLPYVGLSLAVTCGAHVLLQRLPKRYHIDRVATAGLILLVLGGNAVGTFQRNKTWRSEESLWLDATEKSPGNGRALMNYGLTQLARGEFRRARDYFERAAALTPNYSTLEINRGIAASSLGDDAAAEGHFKRALELRDDVDSHFFYGRWLAQKGRARAAIPHLQRAITLSPAAVNPRRHLMTLYFAAGEREQLQRLAADTLAIDSRDQTAARYATLPPALPSGVTYASRFQDGLTATREGRHLEAAVAYRESLALNNQSADAWNNLGWELAALGLPNQAAEAYQAALRIDPGYARARNNLRQLSQL